MQTSSRSPHPSAHEARLQKVVGGGHFQHLQRQRRVPQSEPLSQSNSRTSSPTSLPSHLHGVMPPTHRPLPGTPSASAAKLCKDSPAKALPAGPPASCPSLTMCPRRSRAKGQLHTPIYSLRDGRTWTDGNIFHGSRGSECQHPNAALTCCWPPCGLSHREAAPQDPVGVGGLAQRPPWFLPARVTGGQRVPRSQWFSRSLPVRLRFTGKCSGAEHTWPL